MAYDCLDSWPNDASAGDALIGKKLLQLLTEAGFQNTRLSIQPEVLYAGCLTFVPLVEDFVGGSR